MLKSGKKTVVALIFSCYRKEKKVVCVRSALAIICLFSLMLGACYEAETPASVVATVNGRPIVLKTVQASQEADMADLGIFEQFSLQELRAKYGKTIANLIVYELMLQDLETRGIIVTKEMVDAFEQNVRSDYPEGEFEKYFEENALDINAWREILRYIIALQKFNQEFLRKDFVPSVQDVEAYYAKNKESFVLEENYLLHEAINEKKEALEGIKSLEDLLAKKATLSPYKMRIDKNTMPKEWRKPVFALKENACTDILAQDDAFVVLCLEKHQSKRALSSAEAYVYIEEFLADERMVERFDIWLKEKLSVADIKISAHVANDIAQ